MKSTPLSIAAWMISSIGRSGGEQHGIVAGLL